MSRTVVEKKVKYDQKLCGFMDKYTKAFIVHADNVGSNQMMMIRKARRRKRCHVIETQGRGYTAALSVAGCPLRPAAAMAGRGRPTPPADAASRRAGSPSGLRGSHGQEHHDEALDPRVRQAHRQRGVEREFPSTRPSRLASDVQAMV